MKKNTRIPVSIVIPMRNASTTVLETLKTVVKQKYPIKEIIVVDNVSKDNSREIVSGFAKKTKIPLKLIKQDKDRGISVSYNRGTKLARSPYVAFLMSDSSLPSENELEKLIEPLKNPEVVASYSTSVLPGFVWNTYNFWEKYHAARMVDNKSSLMVLKFDCVKRDTFLKIGGFDEQNFGGDGAIGGEDADITARLQKMGKIVRSKADSLHLHYMASDYTLFNMMKSRKMYARSYGRFLRKSAHENLKASLIFLVKPFLAILPFIPGIYNIGLPIMFIYSFLYSKKMFITKSTLFDPRIILIPILNILLLYYETFWLLQAFLSFKQSNHSLAIRKT
ncbi:glycosyltransferase [Candidatus Parcubacteria bacterium]|nr:MAG: glycosyltransferase [Candidatus Parcubacteria bacterium]